ncbi:MAG TPA: ATP-binding protein [Acidimicrobiales bacterium]|nr:ATP-binding protein [Acidimicrobiales bacterium]
MSEAGRVADGRAPARRPLDLPPTTRARTAAGRWWLDLPLRRKGAVLVVVPLAVTVAVLIAAMLLSRRDTEVAGELGSGTTTLVETSQLVEAVDDAEAAVLGYAATRDGRTLDAYSLVADSLPGRLDAVRQDLPEGYGAHVAAFAAAADEAVAALGVAGDRLAATPLDPQAAAVALAPATEAARVAHAEAESLRLTLFADLRDLVAEADRVQDQTTWVLVTALLAVIATGITGGVILATSILGRTVRLSDNIDRFWAGRPLLPTVAARDEIGHLTATLGRVAALLRRQNDELRASRDEALAAARAKDEFLSRMSHELRTPLTAILGFGQLLQADDLDDDQRESVDHVVRAGHHLLGLIDDSLDIARIETGNVAVTAEPVAVEGVVDEAIALVRRLADDRDVTVAAAPMAGVTVLGDPQRLEQVLLNLLTNAVKYNRPGGRIDVRAAIVDGEPGDGAAAGHGAGDRDSAGGRVRLSVTDTGAGIAPGEEARLFEPFERLDAADRGIDGIGMGLAVAQGLVEAMGGTIGVDSEVGAGSTFWVELAGAGAPGRPAGTTRRSGPPAGGHKGGGPVVLHVEDNPASLQLMARLLRDRPERLEAVDRGGVALARARELGPDLVLLDLNLPDIDGDEVLLRLKADPLTADIPVVVISADATAPRREAALRAGAADYLAKPIDVAVLLELLDRAAQRKAT